MKLAKLLVIVAIITGLVALRTKDSDIDLLREDEGVTAGSPEFPDSGSTEESASGSLSTGSGDEMSGETPENGGVVESGESGAGSESTSGGYNLEEGMSSSSEESQVTEGGAESSSSSSSDETGGSSGQTEQGETEANSSGESSGEGSSGESDYSIVVDNVVVDGEDGETDGENIEEELEKENQETDQVIGTNGLRKVHLSLNGALNFDVTNLLNPCATQDFFDWYNHEISKWLDIVNDPEGFQKDLLTLQDVRQLIQTAQDRIKEVDALPIQALIQLKIKALNKIESMQFVTMAMNEDLETIKELVELLNKAKDGSTALKLCQVILGQLDELDLTFEDVASQKDNFEEYASNLNAKLAEITSGAETCQNSPASSTTLEAADDNDVHDEILIANEENISAIETLSLAEKSSKKSSSKAVENDSNVGPTELTEEERKRLDDENDKLVKKLTDAAKKADEINTTVNLAEKKNEKKASKTESAAAATAPVVQKDDFDANYPGKTQKSSELIDSQTDSTLKKLEEDALKEEPGNVIPAEVPLGFLEKQNTKQTDADAATQTQSDLSVPVEEVNDSTSDADNEAYLKKLQEEAEKSEPGNVIPAEVPLGFVQLKENESDNQAPIEEQLGITAESDSQNEVVVNDQNEDSVDMDNTYGNVEEADSESVNATPMQANDDQSSDNYANETILNSFQGDLQVLAEQKTETAQVGVSFENAQSLLETTTASTVELKDTYGTETVEEEQPTVQKKPLMLISESDYEIDNELDHPVLYEGEQVNVEVPNYEAGDPADFMVNADDNGDGTVHDSNEDTYGSIEDFNKENEYVEQEQAENDQVDEALVEKSQNESIEIVALVQTKEAENKEDVAANETFDKEAAQDDLQVSSQSDNLDSNSVPVLTGQANDDLDQQSVGDNLDAEVPETDGLDAGKLEYSDDMVQPNDLAETQGLVENLEVCENLDIAVMTRDLDDTNKATVDDEPVQPIDNLEDTTETAQITVNDINLLNTYTTIAPKENTDDDQNLLANGINFRVVPEAEQDEIDAENGITHEHAHKHLKKNSNSKKHQKHHKHAEESTSFVQVEETHNIDAKSESDDDSQLLASKINFRVIPEAEQKEIDEQASAIREEQQSHEHHKHSHKNHQKLRRAHKD